MFVVGTITITQNQKNLIRMEVAIAYIIDIN